MFPKRRNICIIPQLPDCSLKPFSGNKLFLSPTLIIFSYKVCSVWMFISCYSYCPANRHSLDILIMVPLCFVFFYFHVTSFAKKLLFMSYLWNGQKYCRTFWANYLSANISGARQWCHGSTSYLSAPAPQKNAQSPKPTLTAILHFKIYFKSFWKESGTGTTSTII